MIIYITKYILTNLLTFKLSSHMEDRNYAKNVEHLEKDLNEEMDEEVKEEVDEYRDEHQDEYEDEEVEEHFDKYYNGEYTDYWNKIYDGETIILGDGDSYAAKTMREDHTELLLASACLKHKKVLPILKRMIKPEMFFIKRYRIIYEVMLELNKEHKTANPFTAQNRLLRKGLLEAIGGADAIDELCAPMVSEIDVRGLAKRLLAFYVVNTFDDKFYTDVESIVYSDADVEDKLYDIKKIIDRLSEPDNGKKHVRNMDELINDTIEQAYERSAKYYQTKKAPEI